MLESQENRRRQVLHRCRRAVAVCDETTLDRLDSLMQGLAAGGVLEVYCLSLEVEAVPGVGDAGTLPAVASLTAPIPRTRRRLTERPDPVGHPGKWR